MRRLSSSETGWISSGYIPSSRSACQALSEKRRGSQLGNAALGRRHLPVPAGQRQREARIGKQVLYAGRAISMHFDIGEQAVHDGAQARVEIAFKGCLKQARQQ